MPEASPAALRPDPPLLLLLRPKWLTARARAMSNERGRGARLGLLAVMGLLFWTFIYTVLFKLLVYFRGVPDLGPFLAGKLLGIILVGFFSILLLSNIITALSSFFLARDLDLLVAGPVDWLTLYGAKLLETAVNSSWMVLLMAIPMFAAFGVAYHGGGGVRARRAAAPSALQHRLQQGAGERAEVRSRRHHAPGRTASALAAQHPQA